MLRNGLTALACALLVSACGGEEPAPAPTLPAALAERLAVRSDAVAERLDNGDSCAARAEAEALQAEVIAALNEQRIPRGFQEELLGSVTALVESIEVCVASPEEEAATEDDEDESEDDDEGRGKGKGKKKGKDKD